MTGATGNIGRRIVDRLVELVANDIRALTKIPAKANLPAGVSVFTGYLGANSPAPRR
ncbi:NmrA family protein [Mycolicibacterium smegmatis MC2 155]|uniref:NmrA family protein n=1 Tax=Mycolicibacterium smegmatis (strain ATCC 700084 / mc(2)155) TaxID=246196 RepID=I7GD07_MYCS2|nr:NmrA family protein [Mycolicibacterium smegmatis MC2 155]